MNELPALNKESIHIKIKSLESSATGLSKKARYSRYFPIRHKQLSLNKRSRPVIHVKVRTQENKSINVNHDLPLTSTILTAPYNKKQASNTSGEPIHNVSHSLDLIENSQQCRSSSIQLDSQRQHNNPRIKNKSSRKKTIWPNSTHSHGDLLDKKRRKKKNLHFCSCPCLLAYLLIIFLLAIAITAALMAALIKHDTTTTMVSSTNITATRTSTTATTTTTTTATTTTTISTTTITTTIICSVSGTTTLASGGEGGASVLYTFDNTSDDYYGNYNAVPVNSPTYVSPGYNGRGYAIQLRRTSSQYLTIANYMNFYQRSLTVEAWVYPLTIYTGNPYVDTIIYGQTYASTLGMYMWMMLRNGSIYGSFYGNDVWGPTLFQANQWQHMAFTYDYATLTQTVYRNGVVDAVHTNAAPCQITSGNQTIGNYPQGGGGFFDGFIDQLTILFNQSKTAAQILADATLVAYYSMDCLNAWAESFQTKCPA